ncbi:hypothetical protein QUF72_15055 [Desulfobacterales bacterium HSG2]|nr:hypothetical protein [Desulfobacterales bacterium HSG2]
MFKSNIIRVFIICFVSLSLFSECGFVFGQTTEPDKVNEEEPAKEEGHISTLGKIIRDMNNLKRQIKNKEKQFRSARTEADRTRIAEELKQLNENLEILRMNFDKIAAGIDISGFEETSEEDFKWEKEVQELLRPVIQEVKKMTARPRQIEKLRSNIAFYDERLPTVQKAIENINALIKQTEEKKIIKQLKALKKIWVNRKKKISSQLEVSKLHLEVLSKEKKSFWGSVQVILKLFFKSRGKNLLLSLLAFISVFLILRLIHRGIYKLSPIHKAEERPFYIRLCDVIYHILTGIGAIFAMLTVLYIYGDWVILTLAVFFLLGFIWAARLNIPEFWEEIKLLLNLGSVREGERVFYKGVPWKVVSLNVYSELENPALKSRIRLPLRMLTALSSYPYDKDAPWFPCEKNEWVILADGTRGEVVSQTHETVQLCLRGGARKTYLTGDFLGLNPLNLSDKFRLKVTFGIDYRHQAASTREIPEKLGKILEEKLKADGFGDDLTLLRVDFKTAAASSLDFEIIADFTGKAAPLYSRIAREIQRFAVEACNTEGWEIPFTQVTIHNAG